MKRHLHQANQRITAANLSKVGKVGQQYLDPILARLLVSAADSNRLAQGESAYFPPDDCKVTHVSGDRSTGVTFQVGAGLGFKNLGTAEADADEPKIQPIYVATAFTFQTTASDPTNPRKDRVFMKPARTNGAPLSVDVIDPVTKNISTSSLNTETASAYAYVYVAGTPAASPSAPAAPGGYTDADAIAEITIAPGSGAFNPSGNLVDLRDTLELGSGIAPGFTSAAASTIIPVAPVLDANVQAALERLDASLVNAVPRGLIVGSFDYASTSSVKLTRGLAQQVRVEIDGVVYVRTSDLTWDFASGHLDTGSEAPSTFYHCYAFNSGGTLVQKISVTAPVMDPVVGKVGYHPSNTSWRWIGSFYNDASSNVLAFDRHPDGWVAFRTIPGTAPFLVTLVNPNTQLTYATVAVAVPDTARAVRVNILLWQNGGQAHYGPSALSGLNVAAFPSPHYLRADANSEASANGAEFEIATTALKTVAYGGLAGGSNFQAHTLRVVGYREPLFVGGL